VVLSGHIAEGQIKILQEVRTSDVSKPIFQQAELIFLLAWVSFNYLKKKNLIPI